MVTFCSDKLWQSEFMALENMQKTWGIFFSYHVAAP